MSMNTLSRAMVMVAALTVILSAIPIKASGKDGTTPNVPSISEAGAAVSRTMEEVERTLSLLSRHSGAICSGADFKRLHDSLVTLDIRLKPNSSLVQSIARFKVWIQQQMNHDVDPATQDQLYESWKEIGARETEIAQIKSLVKVTRERLESWPNPSSENCNAN